MPRRYYSSTAARTTLSASVNSSVTSLTVVAVSGWPSSFPYTLIIDQDTVNEEIVEVTNRSGTTLTVVRGVDGTTAVSHSAGAAVNHGVSARDFDEPNAHIQSTSNPHSVTAAQAGALALAGGTVTGPTVVEVNSTSPALRVTQTGTGNALVVEDSANPDSTPFVVDADGNVGIGISSPAGKLSVKGETYISDASGSGFARLINASGVVYLQSANSTGTAEGDLHLGNHLSTGRIVIKAGGNVGIGDTTPSHRLQVTNGAIALGGTPTLATNYSGSFALAPSGTSPQAGRLIFGDTSGWKFSFSTRASSVTTDLVTISDGGNVGIGTSSPGYPLEVVANASTQGIRLRGRAADNIGVFEFCNNASSATQAAFSSTETYLAILVPTTERMRINNAGLITGTGTSLGAWTAYTPTLGGTGWALGDGTITAAYCQIGKIVHFRCEITFGSTSTYGASSTPTVTLPVTASANNTAGHALHCILNDVSVAFYLGAARINTATTCALHVQGTNGLFANVTSTAPFAWASGDVVRISGTYEAT